MVKPVIQYSLAVCRWRRWTVQETYSIPKAKIRWWWSLLNPGRESLPSF